MSWFYSILNERDIQFNEDQKSTKKYVPISFLFSSVSDLFYLNFLSFFLSSSLEKKKSRQEGDDDDDDGKKNFTPPHTCRRKGE